MGTLAAESAGDSQDLHEGQEETLMDRYSIIRGENMPENYAVNSTKKYIKVPAKSIDNKKSLSESTEVFVFDKWADAIVLKASPVCCVELLLGGQLRPELIKYFDGMKGIVYLTEQIAPGTQMTINYIVGSESDLDDDEIERALGLCDG